MFFFKFSSSSKTSCPLTSSAASRCVASSCRTVAGCCVMLTAMLTHLLPCLSFFLSFLSFSLLRSLLRWPRSWTPAGSSCWRRRRRSLSSKQRGTTPGWETHQHTPVNISWAHYTAPITPHRDNMTGIRDIWLFLSKERPWLLLFLTFFWPEMKFMMLDSSTFSPWKLCIPRVSLKFFQFWCQLQKNTNSNCTVW